MKKIVKSFEVFFPVSGFLDPQVLLPSQQCSLLQHAILAFTVTPGAYTPECSVMRCRR